MTRQHKPIHTSIVDGLILSCGRTGTTYMTEALNQNPTQNPFLVAQEPRPSRSIYMLSNMAYLCPRAHDWARRIFYASRAKLNREKPYIEINPFLTGIAADFSKEDITNGVVHIVRDPVTWVESVMAFGGYSWRSFITPYIPFAHEKPSIAGTGWYGLSLPEKMAWRWLDRNLRIKALAEKDVPYLLVRYEDIFKNKKPDPEILQRIFHHVGGVNVDFSALQLVQEKVNASRSSKKVKLDESMRAKIYKITQTLAAEYGYI